jgi:hypothetical protein
LRKHPGQFEPRKHDTVLTRRYQSRISTTSAEAHQKRQVGRWVRKEKKCRLPFYCTAIVTSLEAVSPTVSLTLTAGLGATPAGTVAFT